MFYICRFYFVGQKCEILFLSIMFAWLSLYAVLFKKLDFHKKIYVFLPECYSDENNNNKNNNNHNKNINIFLHNQT